MPRKKKAKPGRKRWNPTDKERENVKALIGLGLTARQVAVILGVSHETLYKYCKPEIDEGRPFAHARVAKTAFEMATSGKHAVMTMFWLKCRAGWVDQPKPEEESQEQERDPLIDALNDTAANDWADREDSDGGTTQG